MSDARITELVRDAYAALEDGDRSALGELLDREFAATFTEGLPVGGGVHQGPEATQRDGWWAIGKAFAARAEPEQWIECADGRLLVIGRYRGHARSSGEPLDAAFAHLWQAQDGRLTGLWQLTDSWRWREALG